MDETGAAGEIHAQSWSIRTAVGWVSGIVWALIMGLMGGFFAKGECFFYYTLDLGSLKDVFSSRASRLPGLAL
jgi:hypothetical protein